MGADIDGFIEFRLGNAPGNWFAAITIGSLAERYYDLFGYFFGVRGPANTFFPVAAGRGIPSDVAEETDLVFRWCEGESPTWMGWREFRKAIAAGQSIHAYRREADNHLLAREKGWMPTKPGYFTVSERERLRQGGEAEKDGYLYRYEDDGPPGWQLIVELGDRLAQSYGEDRVRLVVWFTS